METKVWKRREVLAGLLATTGALRCTDQVGAAPPAAPEPAPSDEWQRVRAQFDLSPDWVHMGGFLLSSHPKPVRAASERHRRALDDNPVLYLESQEHFGDDKEAFTSVHVAAAAYLGGKPDEIALTDSTTMGLATLYGGLPLH